MKNITNTTIKLFTGILLSILISTNAYSQPQCTGVTYPITNVSCNGGSNGSITITIPSAGAGATYSYYIVGIYNDSEALKITSNTFTFSNLVADTFALITQVTGKAACEIPNLIISQPAVLAIPGSVTNAQCNGTKTGSITATPSGGTAPYTYSWSNGKTTPTISAIGAGTYTVTVTDNNGCKQSQPFTVTQPNVVALSVSPNTSICTGQNTTITASGNGTFSWTPTTGLTNPNIANPTATPASTTTYTVTIDSSGCTNTGNVTVTVNTTPVTPTISAGGVTTFCSGSSVTLTGSTTTPGVTYQWLNGGTAIAGGTNATYSATTSGSYTVMASLGTCSATSTATTVTVNPTPATPTISAGGATTFCTGGSVTLTGSSTTPGVTYQWLNGGTSIAGATNAAYTATTSGSYTVKVTSGSCSATSLATTVTVNIIPATPTITAGGATTFCSGSSVTLTGSSSTPGVTYQWLNGGTAIAGATNATYSATTSGNYTVSAILSGCSSTSTSTAVTVNPTPSTPTISAGGATTFCTGGSVTLTGSSSTTGVTYQWSNSGTAIAGATNTAYTATASGSYTVSATASGCSSTSIATTVTVNPTPVTPTISAGGATTFCTGGNVILTGSTSTAGVTYQWSNGGTAIAGATNSAYTATTSGNYSVTVTKGTCSSISTATTVTVDPIPATPTISAGGTTTFCSGGSVTLTGSSSTPGVTYQWLNGGTAIAGATNTTYTATTSGSYTVSATASGCSSTSTATTVTVNPTPVTPTISAGGATTFCTGGNVILTGSTSTAGVTYQWSNGGTAIAGATNATYTATASGSYTVTVTKGTCSAISTATTVTVDPIPATPTISAGGTTTFCSGGSVTLTGSSSTPGVTYQWLNGGTAIAGATNAAYTATTSGSYTISATASGCSSTSTATTVTVNPTPVTPTISAGGTTTFCSGGSVTLTGSSSTPGVTYQWLNGGTAIAGATNTTYTATTSGSYTISVTASSCSSTSTATTVTVNPTPVTPTISAGGATTFCTGGNVILTGSTSTAGASYQWSNGGTAIAGATNAAYTATTSGSYTVTVTKGTCSAISTATTVTVDPIPATPTISAGGTTTFCSGGSVTLTGSSSTPGVTYQWLNGGTAIAGATNTAYTATTSGSYTISATATGCSSTSIATTVTVNPIPTTPTITAGGPTTFCSGSSVTLTSNPSSGYSFQWDNGGVAIPGATNASYIATTSGTYTVTLNSAGCTSSSSTAVTVNATPATPTISASGPTGFCTGGSVTLTGSSSTPGVTYQWNNNGSTIAGATNAAYVASAAGSYTITAFTGACEATSTITTVTINPVPPTPTIVAGGPTTFCSGSSVTLTSNPSSGYSFQWDNGGVAIAGATNASYIATTSGTYTVTLNNSGCTSSSSTAVTVNATPATPTITPGGPTTFCSGGSVTLTGSSSTPGVTYQWNNNGSTIAGATNAAYIASGAGSYTVTVFTGVCEATSNVTMVTINPSPAAPTISAGGATTFCTGGSVTLTGSSSTPGVTYQWYNNGIAIAGATNAAYTATTTANYTITAAASGCSTISTVTTVTVNSLPTTPTITAGGPTTFCSGNSVTLTGNSSTPGVTYQWFDNGAAVIGATNASYSATTSGSYTISATASGCSSMSTATMVTDIVLTASITAGSSTTFCTGGDVVLTANSGAGYIYQWYNGGIAIAGATSISYTATTSGNYTVMVSDAGCSVTSTSTTVTANPIPVTPTISAGGTTTFCTGDSVTLTGNTSTPGVVYQWLDNGTAITGATSAAYNATATGSYTISATASGCSSTSTATTVTANPIPATPTISAGGATTFCTGASVSLTGSSSTPSATYQWYNNGIGIAGATSATYNATTSGNYTISATASGCSSTSTATTVTVNPIPATPTNNAGGPTTFCSGNAVTLTGSSSTAGVTYQWYDNGIAIVGATNTSYTDSTSGNYTLSATSNGCSAISIPITITDNVVIAGITAASSTTFCTGGSVVLTANAGPGLTYQWYNGGTPIVGVTTISYTAITSGSYTVMVSNGSCSVTSSATTVTVNTIPNTPTISNSGVTTFCSGDSVILTGNSSTSGVNYQWYNNGITIAGATNTLYSASVAGSYTISATANGCSDTSTATVVTVNPTPVMPIISTGGATTFCSGGSITLTGNSSTPGVIYQWYKNGTAIAGANSASYTDSVTGNYTISAALGSCISTSMPTSVTVNTTPATPTLNAGGPTTFCSGNAVTLTGSSSTPGVTYQWFNNGIAVVGATNASYTDSTSGSYTVSVTANACSAMSAPITITDNVTTATITSSGSTTFCTGDSVVLSANAGAGLIYQWNNNGTTITGATTISYIAKTSGNYTVMVSNGTCSTTSAPTAVTENIIPVTPTIAASGTTTICSGSSVTLTGSSPTPGVAYQWYANGTAIAGANTASYNALALGNYTVSATANGCSDTSTATTVTVNPTPATPTISAGGATNFCSGDSVILTGSLSTPGAIYQWYNNGTAIVGANSASYTVSITGNYTISATLGSCSATSTVTTVTVNPIPVAPTIVALGATTFCSGASVTLTGGSSTPGDTYQWYNNGTTIAGASNISYAASITGNYTLSVTANGCSATSTPISVTDVVITASITVASSTTFCSGDSVVLTANAGVGSTYQWYNGGALIPGADTISYTATTSGDYTVTVSNGGCSATSVATDVTANILPVITIVHSSINICNGSSTTLQTISTGNGPFTYSWSPSTSLDSSTSASPLANPTDTTTYTIIITDSNGCQNSGSSTINVTSNPTGTVNGNDTTICQGSPLTITAQFNSGFTPAVNAYSFNGGIFQASSKFTINPINGDTNVSIVLKDMNGCLSNTIIDTIYSEAVKGTVQTTAVSCFNQNNGSITVNIQGGNSGFKFSVDGGSSQLVNVFNTLNAGAHTIIATDTIRGCTFDTTVTITQPGSLQITSIQIQEVSPCNSSNDGSLTLTVTGGTPSYQYAVNSGTWQTSSTFNNLPAGAYVATVKDSLGCTATIDTSIIAPNGVNTANIKILSQTNNICAGKTDGAIILDTTTITGGVKPYLYILNNDTTNYPSFSNLASIPDSIYIKDATGCPYIYTFAILSPAPIQFSTSTTPATCTKADGSISISNVTGGTSPFLYKVDSVTSYGTNLVFTGLPLGNYQVTVQDSNLCTAGQPVNIGPKPGPIPYITVKNTSCYNSKDGIITIDSLQGGIAPYQFSVNGSIDTSSYVFTGLKAGSFSMAITDSTTCSYDVVVYYQWNSIKNAYDTINSPTITINQPAHIEANVVTQNIAQHTSSDIAEISGITGGTPGYQIIYKDSTYTYTTPSTIISGLGNSINHIYIKDSNGCMDTLNVTSAFFIPNIFTPNGDGKNDYFEVVSIPLNSELKIFDRWGNSIYDNTNYDNSWNGDGLTDGVYYYELAVSSGDKYKGWVQILR